MSNEPSHESIVFDQAADFYDETRGFPPGEDLKAVAHLVKIGNLKRDSRILEVGIGTGRVGIPLVNHVDRLYGVDLSIPMMQQLQTKPGSERVALAQADALTLPFADASFDSVIVVHVFHLVADCAAAMREVARVLKPEGHMLNCYNSRHSPIEDLSVLWQDKVHLAQQRHRVQDIAQALDETGWQMVSGGVHNFTQTQLPQHFINMIKERKWSSTWKLSDEDLKTSVEVIESVLKEHYPDLNQPIEVNATFNVDVFKNDS